MFFCLVGGNVESQEEAKVTSSENIEPSKIKKRESVQADLELREDYTVPLKMIASGAERKSYLSMELIDGATLKMGPRKLVGRTIGLKLSMRERSDYASRDLPLKKSKGKSEKSVFVLSFSWPSGFVPTGRIEIRSLLGREYWKREFDERDLVSWRKILFSGVGESYSEGSPITLEDRKNLHGFWKGHESGDFGIFDLDLKEIGVVFGDPFRFCVYGSKESLQMALCSRPYILRSEGAKGVRAAIIRKRLEPTLILGDRVVEKQGEVEISEKGGEFQVIFADGSSMRARTTALPMTFVNQELREGKLLLFGTGRTPLKHHSISEQGDNRWFSDTIVRKEEVWEVEVSRKEPELWVNGEFGVPILWKWNWEAIPQERLRLYLHKHSPHSTYKSWVHLEGYKSPGVQLSTKQNQVVEQKGSEFVWEFGAPLEADLNKAIIKSELGEMIVTSTYEIKRGYPYETSLRLTGGTSGTSIAYFGEIFSSAWFETLMGWENYYLGRLRWGSSLRYFNSLTPLQVKDEEISLNHLNFDVKYRFSPGVWGLDESTGIILGFQQLSYTSKTNSSFGGIQKPSTLLGAGLFWARSMPNIFDKMFNLLPFMRYPKWVDLDFVYYTSNLTSTHSPSVNFLINFHGKVYWTKRFYGEAGVTFKKIGIKQIEPTEVEVDSFIVLGTIGAGINF